MEQQKQFAQQMIKQNQKLEQQQEVVGQQQMILN